MSNYRDDFLENSYYLISNEGFNNSVLFSTSDDYKTFMLYVIENLLIYKKIIISAYSITPTHYYLVIKNLERGMTISDFMRKIQVSYAMYLKKDQNENNKGIPVFKGRFKAKLIKEDDIEKYESSVANDPLKCGLIEDLKDWPYTSAHQITDTGYDYMSQIHIKIYNEGRKMQKKAFFEDINF